MHRDVRIRDKEGSRNLGLEVTSLRQKTSLPNGPHVDSDARLSVVVIILRFLFTLPLFNFVKL